MQGKLNRAQFEFITSGSKETFLIGGYGLGKSFCLGLLAYEAVTTAPGSLTLIASPTMDTLRNATMQQVEKKCWNDKLNLREGIHYVVNQQPPVSWNVSAFSKISNARIVTWRNGSYTVLDSLENYSKHEGAEFDRILIDEFQNVTPDARKVLLGRARGKAFELIKRKQQIYYALTPPRDADSLSHLLQLIKDLKDKGVDTAQFIRGSSYLNKKNLPEGYIESLIAGLDDKSVQRYVHGELVDEIAGRFAYGFDEAKHVKACELQEEHPIYIWMDFNIGVMATLIIQFGDDWLHVIDEFGPSDNIDIDSRCETILASQYEPYLWSATITGDPARGRTGLDANKDYYVRIQEELNMSSNQFQVRKSHPFIKDSRQLINTLFNRFPDLRISPRCVNLIEDFKFCVADKDGGLDKSNANRTHYLDAYRYGVDIHFIQFLAQKLQRRQIEAA